MTTSLASDPVFTHAHILLTASVTAVALVTFASLAVNVFTI